MSLPAGVPRDSTDSHHREFCRLVLNFTSISWLLQLHLWLLPKAALLLHVYSVILLFNKHSSGRLMWVVVKEGPGNQRLHAGG